VGHYVAGIIGKKELLKVLQHFQTSWESYAAARKTVPNPLPANIPVQPQQAQNA
jgi:hypothetical protein